MGKLKVFSFILITISFLNLNLIFVPDADAIGCDSSVVRFSTTSNTVYVTGPVSCTLTEIKSARPSVPLNQVDPANKTWLLSANLKLEQGATLNLSGGLGDVNYLRLKSNNSSTFGSTVWIKADFGTINITNSKVTSWNESAGSPDTEISTYKRAFINARSSLASDGVTPRESRMNIVNSEIGYLGFNGGESYGLSWKVIGSSPGLYDKVGVFGNVTGSRIHHNYFGAYTFGGEGMVFRNNEFDNNIQYGLDPHDDSDNLIIENNNIHNNGNHGLICSKRCNNLTIRNNISSNNRGNGIMLHRNTDFSLVEGNTVNDNTDSGIAVFDSHNNIIRNNTALRNKNGIRFSVGSSNNEISGNEFGVNTSYGIYFYKGSDAPSSGDGRPKNNTFTGNNVHDNLNYTIKLKEGDNNTFTNNTFTGNAREIFLENSQNNLFTKNIFSGANNYYYARLTSTAKVADADFIRVKIGDSVSQIQILNSGGFVYRNTPGIVTRIETLGSKVSVTSANGTAVINFERIDLSLAPSGNSIDVAIETWENLGLKRWCETATLTTITAGHTTGNLKPNTSYTVLVNNNTLTTLTSNSEGLISFNYTGGYSGTKTFEVRESAGISSQVGEPSGSLENPAIQQSLPSPDIQAQQVSDQPPGQNTATESASPSDTIPPVTPPAQITPETPSPTIIPPDNESSPSASAD